MQFRVNWLYQSSLGGPWAVGSVLDLDPALARAINNDSPGVLTEVVAPAPAREPAGDPDAERALAPATGERQVKAARNRAKTHHEVDR